jgi:hypothetical protein
MSAISSLTSYGLSYRLDNDTAFLQLSMRVEGKSGSPICVVCLEINLTDIRTKLLDMVTNKKSY